MKTLKLAASVWILCATVALAQMPEQGIIVTGEGRISAAPDMATITLGVRENADTAKEAMGKVTASVSAIIEKLDDLGVAEKDRQTSRFYLNPVYNNLSSNSGEGPVVTGYEAGNAVTVTVRDLTALGGMLDAVVDIGANDFNGLSFGLQEPQARFGRCPQGRCCRCGRARGTSGRGGVADPWRCDADDGKQPERRPHGHGNVHDEIKHG